MSGVACIERRENPVNIHMRYISKPTHHYLPLGQVTITLSDRNANRLEELQADNRKQSWTRDYFGTLQFHTDLSGAVYSYSDYDYTANVGRVTSKGGNHGKPLYPNPDRPPELQDSQSLGYQYDEASHMIAIFDDALPLVTLYRIDIEGRRARETFFASDGHIHQAVVMAWNAAGWLTLVQDTVMQAKYQYDAVGNRRVTQAAIYWNNAWQPAGVDNWFKYNEADLILINRGHLIDNQIQITPQQGT